MSSFSRSYSFALGAEVFTLFPTEVVLYSSSPSLFSPKVFFCEIDPVTFK